MTAEQFVDTARAKGWFVKKWEEDDRCRVIATHESKAGLDIAVNMLTDLDIDRGVVFSEAAKHL